MKTYLRASVIAGLGLATAALSACGIITSTNRSVFMLFDASGTYIEAVPDAARSANILVAKLQPGDWVGAGQISACSFSEKEIILQQHLPETPSLAANAKRQLFDKLRNYSDNVKEAKWTDIKGAMAQAAFELRQRPEKDRYIVVFSDMIQEVSKTCDTSKVPLDLSGITVVASNVIKVDPAHPEKYFATLKEWEEIVTAAGGVWTMAASPDQLPVLVASQ
jgi:hypothetical protein